jgi:hypothetical protein
MRFNLQGVANVYIKTYYCHGHFTPIWFRMCILKHTSEIALPQFHAELLVVTEALSSCE